MAVPVPILLANAPTASCPIGITHIVVVVVLEGSHLRTRGLQILKLRNIALARWVVVTIADQTDARRYVQLRGSPRNHRRDRHQSHQGPVAECGGHLRH